jgi:hypothetical protein
MARRSLIAMIVLAAVACRPGPEVSLAQQIQLTSPFQTIHDSFYENFGFGGINLGRSGPKGHWHFNTGPASSTPPPFGGYDPAADARFGMRFGGPLGMGFNLLGGQGSTRSQTVTAPTIVVPNGGSGSIFSGSVRPFVTGVIPVVGNAPFGPMPPMLPRSSVSPVAARVAQLQQQQAATQAAADAGLAPVPAAPAAIEAIAADAAIAAEAARPVTRATASTANHGDLSVAEIRRQQAVEDAALLEEIQVRMEKARGCEEAGKLGLAKIYYQQAATRARGDLKQQLLDKLRALDAAR